MCVCVSVCGSCVLFPAYLCVCLGVMPARRTCLPLCLFLFLFLCVGGWVGVGGRVGVCSTISWFLAVPFCVNYLKKGKEKEHDFMT